MKKLSVIIILGLLSFGLVSKGFCWTETKESINENWSILQPYTSAAITVYISSDNTTGTVTGRIATCVSSMSFVFNNNLQLGAPTTSWIDLRLSTSNTIQSIIDKINLKPNWTATLPQGCYENIIATGTGGASYVRTLGAGYDDGLQYSVGAEKVITFSTGSANAITLYLNATKYQAYRKLPDNEKSHCLGYLEANLTFASGTPTIQVYEGTSSTACTIALNVPITIPTTNVSMTQSYLDNYSLVGTPKYAQEYLIVGSTYITGGNFGVVGQTTKKNK